MSERIITTNTVTRWLSRLVLFAACMGMNSADNSFGVRLLGAGCVVLGVIVVSNEEMDQRAKRADIRSGKENLE